MIEGQPDDLARHHTPSAGKPRAIVGTGLSGWRGAQDPAEPQAAERPLRRAGPDPARGPAAGGRGSPHPEAQHRQHRAVRLRRTRGDRGRHRAPPARLAGLQRQPGHLPGAHGGRAVLPEPRPARRQRRRRLHRQRCLRADHDGAAGVPRRRQRDPGPGTRLPAVDRCRDAVRRHRRALRVRRGQRVEPRPRRHRGQDHREHPRPGDHQPQQPHRRRLQRGRRQGPDRHRPPPRAGRLRRRDLREDHLRRRASTTTPRRTPAATCSA